MEQPVEKEKRVRVGITHGDVNGISYEIIIKTLQDQRLMENYTIIVYDPPRSLLITGKH